MRLSYSGGLIRAHDRDRYLLSLFAPVDRQAALWALYAFNYEIARTREVVSDTTLGLIRLQWWRDAFAAIYDGRGAPKHEILQDLAPAILAYDLPQAAFDEVLYAREFDLEDVPPSNLQGMDAYAGFTNAPLMKLAQGIAGEETAEGEAAIARAYGLAGLLWAVPFHARQRRCYLPADLLRLENLSPEDLYRGKMDGLPTVVRAVHDHARSLLTDIRPTSKTPALMAALAGMNLIAIRAAGYNVFSARLSLPPPFRELRLLLASLRVR
jgi:phytoene synthase